MKLPQTQQKVDLYAKVLNRIKELDCRWVHLTDLPSIAGPMAYPNAIKAMRQKHGAFPTFLGLPEMIQKHEGPEAFETFNQVLMLKASLREMENANK
jgi:hypothetical protein